MCSLKLTNRFNINWFVHLRCCLIGANFEWAEPYVYQALVLFTEKSYGLLYAWRKVVPCRRVTPNTELLWASSNYSCILVPRDCDHFGQHQESQPLGRSNFSNTENTWFADFLSLCACSESSLTNLIGWEYETITLRMLRKLNPSRCRDSSCWPKGAQPPGTRMVCTQKRIVGTFRAFTKLVG